jgi:hypothetical protein
LIHLDQTTLSEIGQRYEYNVSVVDVNGIRSSYKTCGNCGGIKIQSSAYDFVIILIAVPIILLVPIFFYLVEKYIFFFN